MNLSREVLEKISGEGTPAFLFDTDAFAGRMKKIREILGPAVRVCFAVKANPFFIPTAAQCADLLEICSQGEMDIAFSLGVKGEHVLYSGVSKTEKDIVKAIGQGMRRATAESLLHLEMLENAAAKENVRLNVLLRLSSGAQFGMVREDLERALAERGRYPHLELEGIHYFCGTQRKKLKKQEEELGFLEELIPELREKYGLPLRKLEYGPGLPVPYFEGDDFSDTLAPLQELLPALLKAAQTAELTVEMGRFFAAECGAYLTSVTDVKDGSGETAENRTGIVILDGGIHQLTYVGQMMGMKCPKIRMAAPVTETAPIKQMLCGSLCTTGDVLVREAMLPGLKVGDVLVFENAGAYTVTEGIALFLSHALPQIWLLGEEKGLQRVRGSLETSVFNTPSFMIE